MSGEPLRVDRADGVATITFDHPPVNLMTVPVFLALAEAVAGLAADPAVRVVILRSANPEWFVAHFDVEAILALPTITGGGGGDGGDGGGGGGGGDGGDGVNSFQAMCETLRTMPKPTIAVIEGRVGGGGSEVTLSCDMRFATPGATFNQPEVALGIIPGGTGTARLPRLIGRSRALEVVLGCDDVDARTAERWGWVNRVLEPETIWRHVERLAHRIATFPAHAVAAAKASVVRAEGDVREHLAAEAAAFASMLGEPSTRRAMERFLVRGGQTSDGERRLGELVGELGDGPPMD